MLLFCRNAWIYQPSAAKITFASRTHFCNAVDQFRLVKSIGITSMLHFRIKCLFRSTFASIKCKIAPKSISVQQTFCSEWMAAAMLLNPTPDPISSMSRLANCLWLWNRKSARINAPRHTCNPTIVKSVDFWCSISMAPRRFRFTFTSPSSSIWCDWPDCCVPLSSSSSAG